MTPPDPVAILARRAGRRAREALRREPLPPLGDALWPILDPLTVKELRGLSRHWLSYAGRVVYVGLIACVLLRWWSEMTSHPGRLTSSEVALFGRTLFRIFVPSQMVLVTLAAISAGSDMILKEIRSGTLGLLDLASLSPSQITASKWKAVMLSATMLLLSGVPVMAACNYLGGVGTAELIWSFTITWGLAAVGAALALRNSCRTHSPIVAILKSVGAFVVAGILVLPFAAMIWMRPSDFQIPAWIVAMFSFLALTGRLLRSTSALVRRRIVDPLPPPRPLNDPELYESNYRRLTRGGPRVLMVQRRIWERHELLWKEWVTRPATRIPLDARIAVAAVVGFVLWGVWICSYEGWALDSFAVIGAGFLALATFNGAVLFGSEKNGLKFDMLLSTPLSTRRIVLTKLLSGLVTPEAAVAVVLAMAVVRGWFSGAGWGGTAVTGFVTLLFLVFSYLMGAAASLYSRTVRSAVLLSAGILGLLVVGVPWIADLLLGPGTAGAGSAPALLAECLDVMCVLGGFRGHSIDFGAAFRRSLIFSSVYAGLILAILAAIFHRFRRLTGRS